MLLWFYCLPLNTVLITIIASVILFMMFSFALERIFKFKVAFIIYAFFTLVSIFLIVYATLIRGDSGLKQAILTPFQSFIDAKEQPEMYRTMLMNVALFVPLGMSISQLFSLKTSVKSPILKSALLGLFLSIFIELTQYIFEIGLLQTDDVLCNTFGAFIGALALSLKKIFKNGFINQYKFN